MDIIISCHGERGEKKDGGNGVQFRRKTKKEHCQVVFVCSPFWPGKYSLRAGVCRDKSETDKKLYQHRPSCTFFPFFPTLSLTLPDGLAGINPGGCCWPSHPGSNQRACCMRRPRNASQSDRGLLGAVHVWAKRNELRPPCRTKDADQPPPPSPPRAPMWT